MLASRECYRRIKAVDIAPLLAALPQLRFMGLGNMGVGQPPCFVTLPDAPVPDEVDRFIQELGLGGSTYRRFFRRLSAGQGIAPHVDDWVPADAGIRRFQVPITSHPEIVMRWPEVATWVHLEPGFLYEVRYDRQHEVVNRTDAERIHLKIDQIGATIG